MPCGKKFGKILKNVKLQYPKYGKKRQLNITWGIWHKIKK